MAFNPIEAIGGLFGKHDTPVTDAPAPSADTPVVPAALGGTLPNAEDLTTSASVESTGTISTTPNQAASVAPSAPSVKP